jgi:hypothetical protein
VQEVLKKVRRANKAAAGGPGGTDYLTLGAWFDEDDAVSEALTSVLNLIAAGSVPPAIVRLLTAGRGLCVPKDDKGGLRPIVVGAVLLRLIGSLALQKESAAINRYFLEPHPIQFGVGVQGGCELMAAAVEAHLGANPSHISMGCDAANAFNSVCRSKLWPVLRERFSSLEAFVRVLYGAEADILFADGDDLVVVKNGVGTKARCLRQNHQASPRPRSLTSVCPVARNLAALRASRLCTTGFGSLVPPWALMPSRWRLPWRE